MTNLLEIAMGRSVGTRKRAGSVVYRVKKPHFSGSVTSISNHQLDRELSAKVQHHTFILNMNLLCFIHKSVSAAAIPFALQSNDINRFSFLL